MKRENVLRRAEWELDTAGRLFESYGYEACVSRAYYAMYTLARLLVQDKERPAHTHAELHRQFTEQVARAEIMPPAFGQMLQEAYHLREQATRTKGLVITPQKAEAVLEDARRFVGSAIEILRPQGR